jgi:hypothetical protein
VLIGRIVCGSIKVGDTLWCEPSSSHQGVYSIKLYNKFVDEARAGDIIGVSVGDELDQRPADNALHHLPMQSSLAHAHYSGAVFSSLNNDRATTTTTTHNSPTSTTNNDNNNNDCVGGLVAVRRFSAVLHLSSVAECSMAETVVKRGIMLYVRCGVFSTNCCVYRVSF